MKLIKIKLEIPKDSEGIDLIVLSDVHLGNRYHDVLPYRKNIGWLYEHPEQQIISLGDLIECSNKHTVGQEDQIMEVDDQIEQTIKDLEPFATERRLWGMIQGNHERRATREAMIDVTRRMASELDVPYYGPSAIFYVTIKNEGYNRGQHYTIFAKHGSSDAPTPAGKTNAILRMKDIVNADLYLMGHVHALDHIVRDIYEVDRGALRLMRKHFVMTGSYLEYGGYSEEKGYAPAGPSGSARIKFHSKEHRISVKV